MDGILRIHRWKVHHAKNFGKVTSQRDNQILEQVPITELLSTHGLHAIRDKGGSDIR